MNGPLTGGEYPEGTSVPVHHPRRGTENACISCSSPAYRVEFDGLHDFGGELAPASFYAFHEAGHFYLAADLAIGHIEQRERAARSCLDAETGIVRMVVRSG